MSWAANESQNRARLCLAPSQIQFALVRKRNPHPTLSLRERRTATAAGEGNLRPLTAMLAASLLKAMRAVRRREWSDRKSRHGRLSREVTVEGRGQRPRYNFTAGGRDSFRRSREAGDSVSAESELFVFLLQCDFSASAFSVSHFAAQVLNVHASLLISPRFRSAHSRLA